MNEETQLKYWLEYYCQSSITMLQQVSERQLKQAVAYLTLLQETNKVMNLTAITEPRDMVIRHLLDSWLIVPTINQLEGTSVLDIGSGAGLPGIPLKIVCPQLEVLLLDSLNKRIRFLDKVIVELGLDNIQTIHARVEDQTFLRQYRESFDIATARAVAALPTLLEYALPTIKVGGYFIALKGPQLANELTFSQSALKVLGGEIVEIKHFDLPEQSGERSIVIIRKIKSTPKRYPRAGGKPRKDPL